MSSFPSVALDIKPPADPLSEYAKVMGIKSMMMQQQVSQAQLTGQNQENQIRSSQIQDQNILRQGFKANGGDLDKAFDYAAQNGVSPTTLIGLHTAMVKQHQDEQNLT